MGKKNSERRIIRTSRKGYLQFYLMVVIIGVTIIFIKLNNLPLPRNVLIASIIFIVLLIKLTEVHRMTHHYEITPSTLLKVEGIFVHRIKRLNYGAMSQIHLNRTVFDKILGIGTIEIAQFSETVRTEIKNINKPEEILEIISKMIKKGHD